MEEGVVTKPRSRPEIRLEPRGLKERELVSYTGVSIDKIKQLIAEGRFPKPIEFGRALVWDKAAVDAKFDEWSGFAGAAE